MRLLACLTAAFAAALALGQESHGRRSIPGHAVDKPPVIDGLLDDEAWQAAPTATGFRDSQDGSDRFDQTTVWLAYDHESIYVAYRCVEPEPARIVANQTRRGASLDTDDRVVFTIDPFASSRQESFSFFSVNARGTQFTLIAGGRATKQEWEGEWSSATRIEADSWTCEMAIPWRLLHRPPPDTLTHTLGVNFRRYQARTQVFTEWSFLGTNRRTENEGRWTNVDMPHPPRGNPIDVLGYAYGGWERERFGGRAGLDVRYRIDTRNTALVSYNPDFSNLEAAVTSIDFSYEERLPSEHRPFFLEGSSHMMVGHFIRPFASVRIPGFDVGAKYYGRTGRSTNVGALATHSFGERSDAVVTVAHAFAPRTELRVSYVGRRERHIEHDVGFARFSHSVGNWGVSGTLARSHDRTGDGGHSMITADWGDGNRFASVAWYRVDPRYLMRNGFVGFTDQVGGYIIAGSERDFRSGPVRGFGVFFNYDYFQRTNGDHFRKGLFSNVGMRFANQMLVSLDVNDYTFLENRDLTVALGIRYPALDPFRNVSLSGATGHVAGRDYRLLSAKLNHRWHDRFVVSGALESLQLGEHSKQVVLSASYDFAKDTSVGGRLVTRAGRTNWYLSYRKSGYGGTEYFVILGDPNSPGFERRLVFKVLSKL